MGEWEYVPLYCNGSRHVDLTEYILVLIQGKKIPLVLSA